MAHAVVADVGDHHSATIPVGNERRYVGTNEWTDPRHAVRTGSLISWQLLRSSGRWCCPDPRGNLGIEVGPFKLSWVGVILLLSAVIASAEILKVSEPGVDNTGEVPRWGWWP